MTRTALAVIALASACALAVPTAAQIDADGGPDTVQGAPAAQNDGRPLLLYLADSRTARSFARALDPLLRSSYPGCQVETHGRGAPVLKTDLGVLSVDGQPRLHAAAAVVALDAITVGEAAVLARTLRDAGARCVWVGAPGVSQLRTEVSKKGCVWVDSLGSDQLGQTARRSGRPRQEPDPSAARARAVLERVKAAGVLEQACPAPRKASPADDPMGGRI